MKETFELEGGNTQQSFYGKAIVQVVNRVYTLLSYGTEVAVFDKGTDTLTVNTEHSQSTNRHIAEFINQFTRYHVSTASKKSINKLMDILGGNK